jgi:hypothetical protein
MVPRRSLARNSSRSVYKMPVKRVLIFIDVETSLGGEDLRRSTPFDYRSETQTGVGMHRSWYPQASTTWSGSLLPGGVEARVDDRFTDLFVSSKCFGPPMVESMLGIPAGSKVLFKL